MKFHSPTSPIFRLTGLLAALCLFTSACATEQAGEEEQEQGPLVTDEAPTDATVPEPETAAKPMPMVDCDTEIKTNLVTVDENAAGTRRTLTPYKAVSKPGTAFYFVSSGPAFTVNFDTGCNLLADPSQPNTASEPVMGGAQGAEVKTTSDMGGASRMECSYSISNDRPQTACRKKPVIIIER